MSAPQHSKAFRRRRFLNWAPLGLTYAFLYMGRYNLTVAKNALGDLMSLEQFGFIFGVGTVTYGLSFLINGPMTDRMGGRKAIMLAAFGSGTINALMGFYVKAYLLAGAEGSPVPVISALYAANMYFQSFGAVAIVKVNSNWFHVSERGTFSAIFGTIISSGIYLAFDVGYKIVGYSVGRGPGGIDATWYVFFVPAVMLGIFLVVDFFLVRDVPAHAGLKNFDTGGARMADDEGDEPIPTFKLLKAILTNPIILTVAAIEFCSGILRNGIMHWYPFYAKSELVLPSGHFMLANWGLILFFAGVTGASFAGLVSDKLFQSRRGPAVAFLYGGMAVLVSVMIFSLGGTRAEVGWIKAPAEAVVASGMRSGDRIIGLEGKEISTRAAFIAKLDQDGEYALTIVRDGKSRDLTFKSTADARKDLKLRKMLVTIKDQEIGGKAVKALHWKGFWAWESGLREGDKVTSVNGKAPEDWGDVQDGIKSDSTPNEVVITRDGEEQSLTIVYPSYAPQTPDLRAKFMKAGPVQAMDPMVLGFLAFAISLCVIGSHGLLSGTATMDFGGKKGTATAVGVIDGAVYLGTGLQAFALGYLTTNDWSHWPIFLLPFAIIGFFFCLKIWNAKPRSGGAH